MQIIPSANDAAGLVACAKALDKVDNEPEVQELQQQLDTVEAGSPAVEEALDRVSYGKKMCAGYEADLRMSPRQLRAHEAQAYNKLWDADSTRQAAIAKILSGATIVAGTTALFIGMAHGVSQEALRLLSTGAIGMGLYGTAKLYTLAAKKIIMPRKIDRKLRKELEAKKELCNKELARSEEELKALQTEQREKIDALKQALAEKKNQLLSKTLDAQQNDTSAAVRDESDFLEIDGCKLRKNASLRHMGHHVLPSVKNER